MQRRDSPALDNAWRRLERGVKVRTQTRSRYLTPGPCSAIQSWSSDTLGELLEDADAIVGATEQWPAPPCRIRDVHAIPNRAG